MPHLERVLRELEVATVALGEDLEQGRAKLKRRAEAVARVAGVTEAVLALPPAEFRDVIARLNRAADAGDSVQQDLAQLKQMLMAEWSRWNQVHQSLAASGRRALNRVDYRG